MAQSLACNSRSPGYNKAAKGALQVASGKRHQDRFEQMMIPHLDRAYNLAMFLLRNHHNAEDIVQDAYLKAFKSFHQISGDDSAAWLLKIVRNNCMTFLKRNAARNKVIPLTRPLSAQDCREQVQAIPDPQILPDAALIQKGTCRAVRDAVAALPLDYREVIVLREFEDMSYQQIATITMVPIGTVMSRLSRARKKLREILASTEEEGGHQNEL